jgi:hypothetical protein
MRSSGRQEVQRAAKGRPMAAGPILGYNGLLEAGRHAVNGNRWEAHQDQMLRDSFRTPIVFEFCGLSREKSIR